jgi:GNAT superfamily N-acetyltransferase
MLSEYPLTKPNRIRLAQAFRDVANVDLSIECVVEGQMGKASVDDLDTPHVFQIQTGPFIYFAGDPSHPAAGELLQAVRPWMIVMPSASGWLEALQAMYGERLFGFDRYSFSAASLSAAHLESLLAASEWQGRIQQMDEEFAARIWGTEHFVDLSDYDSPADFAERGVGFYTTEQDYVLGAAFASLVCSRGIEVSIFVRKEQRQRGLATALGAQLARWCLERRMEPHWDAANPESCKLALKLGYRPGGEYLAYYVGEWGRDS